MEPQNSLAGRALTPLCQIPSLHAPLPGPRLPNKRIGKEVLQFLRREAQASRQRQRVPFYSIREVAHHFALPNTTVSRLFDQLKQEGLLSTLWGAGTVLESNEMDRKRRVRAIVAMPAALQQFSTIKDYRVSLLRISDELWKLGFAPRLLFHEQSEAENPGFAEFLLSHQTDFVIWFYPARASESVTARLADKGIRSISIEGTFSSGIHRNYSINRANAVGEGLSAWRRDGIASVAVVRDSLSHHGHQNGIVIEKCLREAGIPYAVYETEPRHSLEVLRTFSRKKNSAIIFSDSKVAAALGVRAPATLSALFKESRVMLADGPLDLPALPSETLVDLIAVDWDLAAQRIGSDLMNANALPVEEPFTLEAQWLPRMPVRACVSL